MTPDVTITSLESRIQELEVARSFFSDILTSQRDIFLTYTGIVGLCLAVLGYIGWKSYLSISKKEIEARVDRILENKLREFKRELDGREEGLVAVVKQSLKSHGEDLESSKALLAAEIYRMRAEYYWDEGKYEIAVIWWFRGAARMTNLTRQMLDGSLKSLQKLNHKYNLSSNDREEIAKTIAMMPSEYSLEVALIQDEIKRIMKSD